MLFLCISKLTDTDFCLISTEVPPSPAPPDVVEVYEDGAQVVWKPVETNTSVCYTVQCKSEGNGGISQAGRDP